MSAVPFTPAWLADAPEATALLPRRVSDPEQRRTAVLRASERRCEPALLEQISATTPAQERAREILSRPGSTVVCTGQQAGLFGGPLYTVYKAAAAIANARALEAETGVPCVPVFWLQNEDHDFDEIASTTVLSASGALHELTVDAEGDPQGAIWQRRLGRSVAGAVDELEKLLDGLSEAPSTLELVRRCWQPGRSPDEAFRDWVQALFGDWGLLVVDPADPALVEAADPVHRRAIDEAAAISTVLLERCRELQRAGFVVQVHVREGSPLSFVHPEGRGGPRYRLEPSRERFILCGPDVPVDPHACSHSTSALLRPILQDTWLPTAAYVGGPGEIAYFAQLPPLYDHFGIPMPLIVPRARFQVLDEVSVRLLDTLDLRPERLTAPRQRLLADLARPGRHRDPDELTAQLRAPIEVLASFATEAAELDRGLASAVDKTARTIEHATARLVERYRRALARDDEILVDRLDRLLARVFPHSAPQERVHGWPWYSARYGSRFVAEVMDAIQPFDGLLRELRP